MPKSKKAATTTGSKKSGQQDGRRRSLTNKAKKEKTGTFHHQARREVITGEEAPENVPPDRWIREKGKVVNFGGELTVIGKFGRQEKKELLQLVENIGDQRSAKNEEDRILSIKRKKDGFLVYTAKPNMAVAIGKKLHRARKGGELTITWSHFDLPVRAVWIADVE